MRMTLFVTVASLVLAEFVVMTVRPVAARQQRRVGALALRVPVPIWSMALTVFYAADAGVCSSARAWQCSRDQEIRWAYSWPF
jgi:hypothetical protein